MRIYKMLKFSVLKLAFLLFWTNVGQSQVPAPPLSDEQLIQMRLDQFEQLIRGGKPRIASYIFAEDAKSRKTDQKITQTLAKSDLSTFYIESKNVTLQNDMAYLLCDIHCVGLEKALTDNIVFAKRNGRWEITLSDILLPLCQSAASTLSQIKTEFTKKDGGISPLNPVNITYSNKVLIPRNVPWISPYKLTRTHVQNQLGVWLLGDPVDVDLKMYAWPNDGVGFFLDKMWGRIIIGKRINTWIGSYGDHPSDYVIHHPTSLAYGDDGIGGGWIYVTVPYSHELLKLFYNHQNQTATLAQRLIDPALPTPSDIHYGYGFPDDPSDDLIWVADENSNKIVVLDRLLNVLRVFDSYVDNSGNTVPIFKPKKVIAKSRGNPFLQAWISYISSYNTFVTLFYNYPSTPILISSSAFSNPSRLTGLGFEYPGGYLDYPGGGFIVSDEGLNCVHKFDSEGNYICSFRTNSDNNSLFVSPKLVTSSGSNALPGTAFFDIGVMDVWGPTTGLQDFLPGADAINISVDRTGNTFFFRWTFTNAVQESVLIVTESGAFVDTLLPTGGRPGPGLFTRTRESTQLPCANLKLRIKVKPAYNGDYGSYAQDWLVRELSFNNSLPATPTLSSPANGQTCVSTYSATFTWDSVNCASSYWFQLATNSSFTAIVYDNASITGTSQVVYKLSLNMTYYWRVKAKNGSLNSAWSNYRTFTTESMARPVITSITVDKNPIYWYETATITCHVKDCYSHTFTWRDNGDHTGYTFTPGSLDDASNCYIYNNSTSASKTVNLSVTVSNRYGNTSGSVSISLVNSVRPPSGGGGGCPFVFAWDGQKFQEDNNILPQSEYSGNKGVDVTDFYKLLKPQTTFNNNYVLLIQEFEHERSLLDQLKLLVVDHPPYTDIAVLENGELIQYSTPFTLQRAMLQGNDFTSKLFSADTEWVSVSKNDTLLLGFQQLSTNLNMISANLDGGALLEGIAATKPIEKRGVGKILAGSNSVDSSTFFTFRQRPTLVYIPMGLINPRNVLVRFHEDSKLNYANLAIRLPPTYLITELNLVSAIHSRISTKTDITSQLQNADGVYATLEPGEVIELQFPKSPGPPNEIRSFILASRGRYERISDSSSNRNVAAGITQFSLTPNFPNPFNPTTVIKYALPIDAYVTIKIYDILGREVSTLVQQEQTAGWHEVSVDASTLSSGIYFYKLQAGTFVGVKKMVLIK